MFRRHRVIINFNGQEFDDIILKRNGLMQKNTNIDLRKVMKKRGNFIGYKGFGFSLDAIAKGLKLANYKDTTFDYDILKKDEWTEEELSYIKEYTLLDIKVTKDLFEKLRDFFEPFKELLGSWDVREYKYLTSTMPVYAYKVICKETGMKEEYNSDDVPYIKFPGATVLIPTQPEAHNDIYCLDFNSLYPHDDIQGNLYSYNCKCCKEEEKWHGNDLFPVNGYYCNKKQGKIETVLKNLYIKRREFKILKNPIEYAIKIVLNSFYGASGNPVFKNIYNRTTVSDCTLIGRKCIELARKMYDEAGYLILYGDTDSIYLQDPFKDKERLLRIKNNIVNKIKENLPFPSDTFDMGIDDEIKHIWFFMSGDRLKKKNYIYVTNAGKLVVKGMPMIKSDSSGLGYEIFKKYMADDVIKGNVKFSYNFIKEKVEEAINADMMCVARKYKVIDSKHYKNEHSIQAEISNRYGPGLHYLIPNKYVGVGISVRYCTIEEFKKEKLSISAIILNKLWKELEPFLNYVPKSKIIGKSNGQEELLRWTNI